MVAFGRLGVWSRRDADTHVRVFRDQRQIIFRAANRLIVIARAIARARKAFVFRAGVNPLHRMIVFEIRVHRVW